MKLKKSVMKKKRSMGAQKKKKNLLSSFVWKHFSKLSKVERAKCHYCGKSNATKSTNVGTTCSKNHLSRCKVYIKMRLEHDRKQQTLILTAKIMYVGFNFILFI